MSNSKKPGLDPITFIYGVGAAIVLIGAMFKFLGWQFANELFIIGLSVEAVVFLISAFERKEDDKDYPWENVFPQLNNEGANGETLSSSDFSSAMNQFSMTLSRLNSELEGMGQTIGTIKTEMESNAKDAQTMHTKMNEFNQLMDTYNENMRNINQKYQRILNEA